MIRRAKRPALFSFIRNQAPILYFPCLELSGTTLLNRSSFEILGNGTYTGVTLAQTPAPSSGLAPLFDGINDYADIYSPYAAGAFNGAEGSLVLWLKAKNAALWTDNSQHYVFTLVVDANNYIKVYKFLDNTFWMDYCAGGVYSGVQVPYSSLTFDMLAITWSAAADKVQFYYNNSWNQMRDSLGDWAGSLDPATTLVGALNKDGNLSWYGHIAHVAIWDHPLSAADIIKMYNFGRGAA